MKALSIRQPWATLIALGVKTIENRDTLKNFRGDFLIHASKQFDEEGYEWCQQQFIGMLPPESFQCGGIVGKAEIYDCVTESDSIWFRGKYGFLIRHAQELPFTSCAGKLGFWCHSGEFSAQSSEEEIRRATACRDRLIGV